MRMCIEIDDQLMQEALRLSGLRSKSAVVEKALRLLAEMDPTDVKQFMREIERDKQSLKRKAESPHTHKLER
jgi:Arc/MetJ family transcription regulator